MGFDHPQWEMYSSSKHGVREELKQLKIQSESSAAPTCQTCHMQNGNHEVSTAWGFLAVFAAGIGYAVGTRLVASGARVASRTTP